MNFLLKLNLQQFAGEKTEKATPKKKQDSRKKGQVAKSQDIGTAFVLLGVFFLLNLYGPTMLNILEEMIIAILSEFTLMEITVDNMMFLFINLLLELIFFLGPVMGVAMVFGVLANYLQVGVLFTGEPMKPKLEKIDPIKGFKRIFSMTAIVNMIKSILKIIVLGLVTFLILWNSMDDILILFQKNATAALATISSLVVKMGLWGSMALLILAILDYIYQKYDHEKKLRMSKQDIKDEYKNIEGDPLIKSKIKQKQREMAMRRMMDEVPNADVVITNPTHYAVAIKYDETKADAPYVVAKGVDFVAQKIKLIAKEKEIVMIENRPLARALYSQVEINQTIPEEFFKAVAEILAYVYRMKKKI